MEKIYNLKPQTGKFIINLDAAEYLISSETSETGVITITCTPSELASKELESLLGSINQEIENNTTLKSEIQDKIGSLKKEKLNIEELLKR